MLVYVVQVQIFDVSVASSRSLSISSKFKNQASVEMNLLVSAILLSRCTWWQKICNKQTDGWTEWQTKYCNPCCTCAPRVNYQSATVITSYNYTQCIILQAHNYCIPTTRGLLGQSKQTIESCMLQIQQNYSFSSHVRFSTTWRLLFEHECDIICT